MKKYIINACMAVTLMAGATSCSNEELVEKQLNPTGDLMLSANIGTSSRTSVDETGKATWVKGDKLYAWGNGSNAEFTLYEGAGKVEGLFTGELKKGYSEYLEKVAYPLEMVTEESGKVYVNLSEVNYGNSSAPMYGTISDGNVAFNNLTSMLRIRVKNMPDNATLTVSGKGIGGKAELKDGELKNYPSTTQTVTVTGIAANAEYVDIPVYAVGKVSISIKINTVDVKGTKRTFSNIILEKGKVIRNSIPELSYVEGQLAEIWDGETIDTKWYNDSKTSFTIKTPAQLAGLAKLVNDESKTMKGKTINLGNSMDMNNEEFNAIGLFASSKNFQGKFDGKNKVISGLNVKGVYGGLFGAVRDAAIENLTIVDSKFEGSQYCGCLVAFLNGNLVVNNVVAIRSTAKEDGVEYQNRLIGSGGDGKATLDNENYINVKTADVLYDALKSGGTIVLTQDIILDKTFSNGTGLGSGFVVENNKNVHIDLNGKKIKVSNPGVDPVIYSRVGSTLTIDGNGIVEIDNPGTTLIVPGGNVIIENGTFKRNVPENTVADDVEPMFSGVKISPWESTGVIINGGYFDGGYYDKNVELPFSETENDIANRGKPADKNLYRTAIKNTIMKSLNRSSEFFKIYGGTFVGVNPAWGDEGCMLPTKPNYLRPWSYYQGAYLDGQTFNENGIVLPEGYNITEGKTADGRPTYTVNYNK